MDLIDGPAQPPEESTGGGELVVDEVGPTDFGAWIIETEGDHRFLLDLDNALFRLGVNDGGDEFDVDAVLRWPKKGESFALSILDVQLPEPIDWESRPVHHIVRFPEDLFPQAEDMFALVEQAFEMEPRNAWLLMADSASMPTEEELVEQRTSGEEGLPQWTCPKHIQPGDVVFLYFKAPDKEVRFAARALTYAWYDPTSGVNSVGDVDPHQWWTLLSPLVPVDPIPFKQLEECFGHKLILRGKPTHYVPPRAFDRIVSELGELDDEQALVLQRPVGNDELPPAATIGLAELNEMAAGALATESMVEEYIVEPLLSLAFPASDGFRITRQHRLESGRIPDFAVSKGDELVGLVEAKLGIGRGSGPLAGCPEVEQILRYCKEAGLPGLLIDANEIVLVSPDADEPVGYVDRVFLSDADLTEIAGFLAASH